MPLGQTGRISAGTRLNFSSTSAANDLVSSIMATVFLRASSGSKPPSLSRVKVSSVISLHLSSATIWRAPPREHYSIRSASGYRNRHPDIVLAREQGIHRVSVRFRGAGPPAPAWSECGTSKPYHSGGTSCEKRDGLYRP